MLSLETLQCFCEGARLLSFRAAARSVALTPAAFGYRIQQLELQLGKQLFHRTTRQVTLTKEGLALVPFAERALAAARECERSGSGNLAPLPVELTIGTRHELGMSWILPMHDRLRQEHPGLIVHLYFGSSADLLIRVRSVEIDCAIGSMRVLDPKLDSIRLHKEDYVFVGRPGLLAKRPLRRPDDAREHTLIDTHADLPLYGYFRNAPEGGDRFRFGRILRFGTIAAIRELVLRGEGVAVLPAYLVAADLRTSRLTRVLPKIKLLSDYFRLIFRSDDPRRSVYDAMAQTLTHVPLS